MNCLFCKIINNEVKSLKLYEDDFVIVILDAYPNNDGHTLIIPKKHYNDFTELDNEIVNHIMKISNDISKILMKKLDKKSLTTLFNYGESQAIKHFHLHLIPDFHKSKPKYTPEEVYNILTTKYF